MIDILLYTQNIENAQSEIRSLNGRVSQIFTNNLFFAHLPESVDIEQLNWSATEPKFDIDNKTKLAARAWAAKVKKDDQTKAAPETFIPWDSEGFQAPEENIIDDFDISSEELDGSSKNVVRSTGTPTSLYMIGTISVGLFIVSGNEDNLKFSEEEQELVIREVEEGLDFLTSAEPRANITFVYDIQLIDVDAKPKENPSSYLDGELYWRDAALENIGHTSLSNYRSPK